jgi:endonuclease/exonuclease/phosphatase (EEP) superfamily protein YafD
MINSNIRILQVNLNRSSPATESALQIAIELKVDLLVVQEPWLIQNQDQDQDQDYSNTRSTTHPSFLQILPVDKSHRPRTLVYVSRTFRPLVSLAATLPRDPDLLVLDIIEGKSKIQLLNIYYEDSQSHNNNLRTLEQVLYSHVITPNSLILGDFNTHHP